ncbi:MAG: hypothetical protein Q8L06_12105 [Pseudohongiella sp.]|nr:hypothetical protein [Pseudohongiella sp.]
MMIYLLTIAGFYLLMGLAIMLGADLLASAESPAPSNQAALTKSITSLLVLIAQLAIGIGLFVVSFSFDSSKPGAWLLPAYDFAGDGTARTAKTAG